MIKLIRSKKYLIVTTDFYRASISIVRGGTIRKICSGNYDTGLKREGCEYWEKGKIHYEQEFGRIINLKIKEYKNSINIDVNTRLRIPLRGKFGGECITKYIFRNSKIIAKSMIFPKDSIRCYDKYVCFNHNSFTGYSVNNKYFDMPKNNFRVEFEVDDIKLIKGKNSFIIKSPNASMRMYKTKSMVEIKPKFDDKLNKYMIMEYIYGQK